MQNKKRKVNLFERYKISKLFSIYDIIIILIIVALICVVIIMQNTPKDGLVYIYEKGKIIGTYQLSEDRIINVGEIEVDGIKKPKLIVHIEGGKVFVTDSQCKDHYCEHDKISSSNVPIICLPNNIAIEIKGENNKFDLISR